jgi:phosphatidylglycerol:prolipoprotein diacylglycerol transferase
MDYIEFPKLGIHLKISPDAFRIGNIQVRWYGIIIAFAIMIALFLATKQSKKFGFKDDDIIDMFIIALPVSVIFARLFFVVFTWDLFRNDFLGIFRIWEGGLAIYGGIIGGILSVYIFSRWKKINMLDMCDFACVYLPLAQAIGRWGNFTNQELYGANTDLPWGMTGNIIKTFPAPGINPDLPVHPTFLYESILNVFVFFILLRIRKRNKIRGSVLAFYLMLYSLVRFCMEFLRTDEFGTGNIRYNQIVAFITFVGAAVWLMYLIRRSATRPGAQEETAPSAYSEVLKKLEEDDEDTTEPESGESESGTETEQSGTVVESVDENSGPDNEHDQPDIEYNRPDNEYNQESSSNQDTIME